MGTHILSGNPPISVALRRSRQARRLSLRISRRDGSVTLTLPARVALAEGIAFLRDRESWLRGHLERLPAANDLQFGSVLPFRGDALELVPGAVRRPVLAEGRLILPGDEAAIAPRVAAFLKSAARDDIAAAADRHARALGRPFRRLTLRDTRSRWGSCTMQGDLMFSWRLVMAPPPVLDYVAAHEVAHLAEMNHSPAFWAVVARLCPGYSGHRAWLRRHGDGLQSIRLG